MGAVLCLPACLCVRRSVPRGQAPDSFTAAEVTSPSVPLGGPEETNGYPDSENLKSVAECQGGP